jgi:general stress protein YciG
MGSESEVTTKSKRGFATMGAERQREIASKGGKAAHAKGTGHQFTSEEAKAAGRKGGRAYGRGLIEAKSKVVYMSKTYHPISWAEKSMMLVTGDQGTGKTVFTTRLLEGYGTIRVSGDRMGDYINNPDRLEPHHAMIIEAGYSGLSLSVTLAELREFLTTSNLSLIVIETTGFVPPAAFDVVIQCANHQWTITRSRVQRDRPSGDIVFPNP